MLWGHGISLEDRNPCTFLFPGVPCCQHHLKVTLRKLALVPSTLIG
jgi:hypothetical protein